MKLQMKKKLKGNHPSGAKAFEKQEMIYSAIMALFSFALIKLFLVFPKSGFKMLE